MKSQLEFSRHNPDFDDLVRRNVDAINRIEQAANAGRTKADTISDAIAAFCGSTLFVYVHCVLFAGWLTWNAANFIGKGMRFDPPPFYMLTLVVSLEAIFLSTFILISQNRQRAIGDQRNHLDLQINMLAEQESSQILAMLRQIMNSLDIEVAHEEQVTILEQNTNPEQIAEYIQENIDIGNGTQKAAKSE